GRHPGRQDRRQSHGRTHHSTSGRCPSNAAAAGGETLMIDGVVVKACTVHADDRGHLIEIIRDDEPVFREVKQTTYTVAYPGVVKAFHCHKRQWDVWFIVSGMAQVVLYDLREGSPTCGETQVLYMGIRRPMVVAIPPGVAHGYRCL